MVRQVNEGARVRLTEADICMNSKSEFHQPGIVRVIAVRGNVNEEQAGLFPRDGRGGGPGATAVETNRQNIFIFSGLRVFDDLIYIRPLFTKHTVIFGSWQFI